jgi:hypothetical protein
MVDGVRVVTDIIKNMLDSDCMPKFDVLSIPAGMETPNMLDILGPRTVFARECRKTGVLRMFFRRSINKASHRLIKAVASELHQHAEWLCSDGIRNEYEWSEKMLGIVTMAVRYDKQGVELGDWEAQYGSMGAGADSDDEYERKRKYGHNQTLRVHKRIKVQCAQCISRESQLAARMAALATARATLASESADSTVASIVDVRAQQAARLAAHSGMKAAIDVRKGIVNACENIDTIVSECKSKLSTLVQSVTLT